MKRGYTAEVLGWSELRNTASKTSFGLCHSSRANSDRNGSNTDEKAWVRDPHTDDNDVVVFGE